MANIKIRGWLLDACLASLALFLTTLPPATVSAAQLPSQGSLSYGLIIDAGSTGSRIYPFYWRPISVQQPYTAVFPLMTPSGKKQLSAKIEPGLSDIQPANVANYLAPLIANATQFIPASQHANTPIYLKATAGMRLLSDEQSRTIIDAVSAYFGDKQKVPFKFNQNGGAKVIPGEQEGTFGWMTANILLNDLAKPNLSTVATIDMGGASTQIAFQPTTPPLNSSYQISVNGTSHDLYAHSYLRMGAIEARKRIVAALPKQTSDKSRANVINDPCQFRGAQETFKLNQTLSVQLVGTGDFKKCSSLVHSVLIDGKQSCQTPPCGLDGIRPPSVPQSMPIYATSNYFDTAEAFKCSGKTSVNCVFKAAQKDCSTLDAKAAAKVFSDLGTKLNSLCFGAAFVEALLVGGYNLSPSRPITFIDKLDGLSFDWALGAMVDEVSKA